MFLIKRKHLAGYLKNSFINTHTPLYTKLSRPHKEHELEGINSTKQKSFL